MTDTSGRVFSHAALRTDAVFFVIFVILVHFPKEPKRFYDRSKLRSFLVIFFPYQCQTRLSDFCILRVFYLLSRSNKGLSRNQHNQIHSYNKQSNCLPTQHAYQVSYRRVSHILIKSNHIILSVFAKYEIAFPCRKMD